MGAGAATPVLSVLGAIELPRLDSALGAAALDPIEDLHYE